MSRSLVTESCRFPATFIAEKNAETWRDEPITQKPLICDNDGGCQVGMGRVIWGTVDSVDPECMSFTTTSPSFGSNE